MKYMLVTGATGLLGRYLLRDLTLADVPLAVIARGSRAETASQRIETVMARWERELGRSLLRPVVLEGDLKQPLLGLADSLPWIAEHCDAMLHSAASLTFVDKEDGEPWVSNLQGTRYVLELIRNTGIKQIHYVSTAYICGKRRGKILETELDLGQEPGNPYEASKLAAEREVIAARPGLASTIYRPSIIVGDAQTGFTPTFHGFYAPLRLAHAVATAIPNNQLHPQDFLEQLQLQGWEGKNLIPVDWVSAVMTSIITDPAAHGKTYHLTNPRPTAAKDMLLTFTEVISRWMRARYSEKPPAPSLGVSEMEVLASMFREQMKVYEPYWNNDPEFDSSITTATRPHLPCPAVDDGMLDRLAQYALDANFGWPREASIVPPLWVMDILQCALDATSDRTADSAALDLNLCVSGPGGGQWQLKLRDGRLLSFTTGRKPGAAMCLLTSDTLGRIIRGDWNLTAAVDAGRAVIVGKRSVTWELTKFFEALREATADPTPAFQGAAIG